MIQALEHLEDASLAYLFGKEMRKEPTTFKFKTVETNCGDILII